MAHPLLTKQDAAMLFDMTEEEFFAGFQIPEALANPEINLTPLVHATNLGHVDAVHLLLMSGTCPCNDLVHTSLPLDESSSTSCRLMLQLLSIKHQAPASPCSKRHHASGHHIRPVSHF